MKRIERSIAHQRFLTECIKNPIVLIEITSKCNFFCDYCISENSPREKGYIGMDLYTHIIDQVGDLTREQLRLHIDGEPTTHPKFYEMALMANERGHVISLATNGSALKKVFLDIEMNMHIHLSVTEQELARRTRIKFPAYLKKIQDYIRAWKDTDSKQSIFLNIYLELEEFANEQTKAEKAEFATNFLKEVCVYNEGQSIWSYVYHKPNCHILMIRQSGISRGAIHGGGPKFVHTSLRGFCDSPWKTMGILQDGRISYCCNDLSGATAYTKAQEIYQHSLKYLWLHHPNITRIRKETLGSIAKNPICKKCISSYSDENRDLFMEWGQQFKV